MAPTMSMEDQNRVIALSQGSHAMRLGNTIYTSPLMNGPHPMPIAVQPATSTASADAAPMASAAPTTTTSSAPTQVSASSSTPAVATATNNTTASTVTANVATSTLTNSANRVAQHNPLPQNLIDDMVMMKALSQYKGVAAGPTSLGTSLDTSN